MWFSEFTMFSTGVEDPPLKVRVRLHLPGGKVFVGEWEISKTEYEEQELTDIVTSIDASIASTLTELGLS